MTERLLQFIWQQQYFNKGSLACVKGEVIQVIFQGNLNSNQGPDFTDARIRVGETIWAGTVELHINTSGWNRHGHQDDPNYRNVILHVVWEDDTIDAPQPQPALPVLELKNRVSALLLHRYEAMMYSPSIIPCEKMISEVPDITWTSWKDRLLAERLTRKAAMIENLLRQNNYHWEETSWWLLARNFGIKVNADAFEAIARSVPLSVLAKHKTQHLQVEAILMGQAGLLEARFRDAYPAMLQKEYRFLKKKYGLIPPGHPVHFLRMRPVNFPSIRLAQLATLVHRSKHLFAGIREEKDLKTLRQWFDVSANDYWSYHYRFDDDAAFLEKKLGEAMTDNILINTVSPLLFTYGLYHNLAELKTRAVEWLGKTSPEVNRITKGFQGLGVANRSAFDSQALAELNNMYCYHKNCLACGIGNAVLKG